MAFYFPLCKSNENDKCTACVKFSIWLMLWAINDINGEKKRQSAHFYVRFGVVDVSCLNAFNSILISILVRRKSIPTNPVIVLQYIWKRLLYAKRISTKNIKCFLLMLCAKRGGGYMEWNVMNSHQSDRGRGWKNSKVTKLSAKWKKSPRMALRNVYLEIWCAQKKVNDKFGMCVRFFFSLVRFLHVSCLCVWVRADERLKFC